jgi:hypothetical protein
MQAVSAADGGGREFREYKESDRKFFRAPEVTEVYKSHSFSSKVVDTLMPNNIGLVLKSNVWTYPGKVMVRNAELARKYGINIGEPILYFGSHGEMLQPVLQLKGGEEKMFEESFDSHSCAGKSNSKDLDSCWLKILEEPVKKGWSQIRYGEENKIGWVYTEILVNDIQQEPGVD